MLASTVKFSKYNRHPTPTTSTARDLDRAHNQKNQPTHTTRANQTPQKRGQASSSRHVSSDPSGPNNVSDTAPTIPHVPLPHPPEGDATPARGAAGLYL